METVWESVCRKEEKWKTKERNGSAESVLVRFSITLPIVCVLTCCKPLPISVL